MLWFRKGIVGLLSLVLLISLLGLAFTTSLDLAFSQPKHLTTWVEQSGFYNELTNVAVSDGNKAVGNSPGIANSTFSKIMDPAIKQSFATAYPQTEFNKDISTFINSNYAWLKGQSTTPNFNISVSQVKSDFASKVSSYFATHLQSLPTCTTSQEIALQSANYTALSCNPETINLNAIQNQIISEINSSNIVVSKDALTANNVLQRHNNEPYYTKFDAPKVYKHLSDVPFIFGAIAIVSAICILFLSIRKAKALRKISGALIISGVILLLVKLVSSKASSKLAEHASKNSTLSQFQSSVESLARTMISYLSRVDMWFGISYLILALILLGLLLQRHKQHASPSAKPKKIKKVKEDSKSESDSQEDSDEPKIDPDYLRKRLSTKSSTSKPANKLPTAPTLKSSSQSNKKRRLIQ